MLEVARRRLGTGASLTVGDAARMPYPDRTFDLVLAATVLHEMPPQVRTAALGEMKRVLRPGGRMLLIDFEAGRVQPVRGCSQGASSQPPRWRLVAGTTATTVTSWPTTACHHCLTPKSSRWTSARSSAAGQSACTCSTAKAPAARFTSPSGAVTVSNEIIGAPTGTERPPDQKPVGRAPRFSRGRQLA
jgi:SAM-dependent methyltransferase